MLRRLFIFIALVVPLQSFGVESGSGTSLEEAKRFAVQNNFEVTSLRKALDETKAQRARLTSQFLPKIGVAGGADSEIAGERNIGGVGYVYGNLNLFRGFEDSYKVSIADLEVEKAEIRLSRAEFRVGLDIEKEFSRHLFTKIAIDLKRKALEVNEAQKKIARKRQESGLVIDSDMMEFDLRDSLLQSDIASLEQELEAARVNLRRLLGEQIGSAIEPVGELKHWHLKGSLPEYLKRLQEESEPVLVASKDLKIAEIESKLWRSKWMPEVDIETKYGLLPFGDRFEVTTGTSFRGTVLAKFDLFSGFDTVNQRREGEAKRLKLEAQLRNVTLNATSEVETLYRKIKAIEARVHLEEQNETRAKKYHGAVISEYKRGVRNSADVRLAAEVLFDAGLRRQNFKYEFITNRIELERLLGSPASAEPMPEKISNLHEDHEFLQKVQPRHPQH